MTSYYKAVIEIRHKKFTRTRTIFTQSKSTEPASDVLTIVRKIPFAKLIGMKKIDRETYIKGVSGA